MGREMGDADACQLYTHALHWYIKSISMHEIPIVASYLIQSLPNHSEKLAEPLILQNQPRIPTLISTNSLIDNKTYNICSALPSH